LLVSKLEKIETKGASIRFALPEEEDSLKSPTGSDTLSSSNAASIDKSLNSSMNAKQKGRFSVVEGNSDAVSLNKFEAKEDTSTPTSTSTCN